MIDDNKRVARRHGRLLHGNPPGDPSTAPRCGARARRGTPCRGPRHAQRAVQNARRYEHEATDAGGVGTVPPCQMEARRLLGRGDRRATVWLWYAGFG